MGAHPSAFRAHWINSHIERDYKRYGLACHPDIPLEVYAGNLRADLVAGEQAQRHEVAESLAEQQKQIEQLAEEVPLPILAPAAARLRS